MELFETHCHLDLEPLFVQFDTLVDRARRAGVHHFMLAGVTRYGWDRITHLCQTVPGFYGAPGLHPLYLDHHRTTHLDELERYLACRGVVAVGEIGLDYYPPEVDRNAQQELFEGQLYLAAKAGLPLLLHIRKAHDQVLATLRRTRFTHGGIVHAFSGSYQQACQFVDLGFYIGVCGTVTYDRAQRVRRTLTALDQRTLVLETDSPDIPLAGHRDGPNLPEYLPEILQCLAELRGEPVAELARITTANAKKALHL